MCSIGAEDTSDLKNRADDSSVEAIEKLADKDVDTKK